jgi:hypothetical protein
MANASPAPQKAEQLKALSSRAGALALALLMLLSACATGGPAGRAVTAHGDSAPLVTVGQSAREEEAVFVALSADFEPVRVSDEEFRGALVSLVLDTPLQVASCRPPLYVGRKLALASVSLEGEAWRSELARAYGRFCERRGSPGDCLTLFEDGPHLDAKDKRGIALALAVGPALEARDAELRSLLSSSQLWTTVSIALGAYLTLLAMPEPISKGVASVLTLVMWGYLGWEFFDLLRAYIQLSGDAERATTFAELREAGERFGRVIGPNSVRILVMLGTAALGESAALLSRGSKLPGFGQAARAVEVRTGVRSMDAVAGAERVILSIPEGSLHIVLPANALAMTAPKGSGGQSASNGGGASLRAFKSFDEFKKHMGPAGKDKNWHHIVEQHQGNLQKFGPEALHNTANVISIDAKTHVRISAWYSSRPEGWSMTIRQWVSQQSYEAQREYGLSVLRRFGAVP